MRFYDVTTSTEIAGTSITRTPAGISDEFEIVTPTMPTADDLIAFQQKASQNFDTGWGHVVALQRENLPTITSISPDPTMPTGYHCFISQFVKNMIAGNIPFKTPDGVNRCW
jgi:hypothetical protein